LIDYSSLTIEVHADGVFLPHNGRLPTFIEEGIMNHEMHTFLIPVSLHTSNAVSGVQYFLLASWWQGNRLHVLPRIFILLHPYINWR
jgi:hypothetical protein